MTHMWASHRSMGVLGKGLPSPITQSRFSSGMFRLLLFDGGCRRRLTSGNVKRVPLATHFFLVAGLRLYGAFFMVELNPQARVVLAFLLFPRMVPSVPYGGFSVEVASANALASVVNAIVITIR